jgi:hypothetical protein
VLGQLLEEGGTEEQALAKDISHAAQLARDAGGCLLPRPRRGEHLCCQVFLLAWQALLFAAGSWHKHAAANPSEVHAKLANTAACSRCAGACFEHSVGHTLLSNLVKTSQLPGAKPPELTHALAVEQVSKSSDTASATLSVCTVDQYLLLPWQ